MKPIEKRIFVISVWAHGLQASCLALGSNDKKLNILKIIRCEKL